MVTFIKIPNMFSPPSPLLTNSMVCVNGESIDNVCPQLGSSEIGIKIPLTKSKGMRTKFMGIITCSGCCPGIDANMRPIAAKQKADSRTPSPSDTISVIAD